MNLTPDRLAADLKRFIAPSYPAMEIRVTPWDRDPARIAIYFTEPKFALIYPYQRWHYLTHLIPAEYQQANLDSSVWFELAPGEKPEDLRYPDEELIDSITPDVMMCLLDSRFFELLDKALCPEEAGGESAPCWGDFRHSRPILLNRGFKEDELFDVFHVLMRKGGFCDCEILYNAAEHSRLKAEYWTARAEGRDPYDPHRRA
jgi:Protein of unknown function (DUF2695)